MITEVWFETVDGDDGFESVVLREPESSQVAIPQTGERVGVWQDEMVEGTNAYILHFVIEVRHYVLQVEVADIIKEQPLLTTMFAGIPDKVWKQEVHVMCSSKI